MVYYFTGTGNSAFAAVKIAEMTGMRLFSLNEAMKTGSPMPQDADRRVVVVCPTYAWRIPRVVRERLLAGKFASGAGLWFVMTCGSEVGNAQSSNSALAERLGLEYKGTAQIVMPENYIALFDVPGEHEAEEIVERAVPDIENAARKIEKNETLPPLRVKTRDRILSGPVNPAFYALIVKARAFRTTESCTGCGKCVSLCPLGNISMKDKRPHWGNECTHCMACVCLCPHSAIEYGKKSLGKPRYRCPEPGD